MKAQLFRNAIIALSLVTVVGCATTGESESTGQFIDNTVITTKVKSDLALSEDTSALDISVDSFKGTVILSGFVNSEAEKLAAGDIARKVEGVVEVDNALVVK